MIFVFYFLLSVFSINDTKAAPLSFLIVREISSNGESSTNPLNRTLFGIIWSCLSTTILCAWTAVHPNVPPRNKWRARWNRLKLMFWMVVAPELVLAWAVRQFFAARQIRDEYNQSRPDLPEWMKWTLVHGHMVEMGGFTLVDPEDEDKNPNEIQERSKVLTVDDLRRLLQDQTFKFPSVSVADIADRSKGDTLFKLIAILQTTWFILQCISRAQQRLALTESELVTLALASLNAVTFGIWWYKPLGVQEPVKIYWKMERPKVEDSEEIRRFWDRNQRLSYRYVMSYRYVVSEAWEFVTERITGILEFFSNPCDDGPLVALFHLTISIPLFLPYLIIFLSFVLFPLGIILLLRIIETESVPQQTSQQRGLLAARIVVALQNFRYSSSSIVTKFVEKWLNDIFDRVDTLPFLFGWFILLPSLFMLLLVFTIFLTPFLVLLFLVSFIFTAVFSIVTTSTIHPRALHVPSFYAPATKSDRWSRMLVFALFGVIFGGVHCIGWSFEFPSHSEQLLWRSTSLTITAIPLIVAPIDFFLTARLHDRDIHSCKKFERISLLVLDLIMTILLFIYVPTRLSLIAQALALLRHQPLSALVAVNWTKYVPHLFS